MTVFLSLEDVLEIHGQVIAATGGAPGIRDTGLLDSAIHRPQASFAGIPFYASLAEQAAALLQSLATNHALVDGNKRTAFTATDSFLRLNQTNLQATEDATYDFVIKIATNQLTFQEIVSWIAEKLVAAA